MDVTKLVFILIIGVYIAYRIIMEYIYFKKMRDGKIYLKELNKNTPYLSDDELPDYCESSGFVFNNFRPLMDAKVEYENGELAVKQSNGKEDFIPLSDITKCTIEPFFLIEKEKLSMMIRLKATNFGRLRFTTLKLEPWRTILETAVERNSTTE